MESKQEKKRATAPTTFVDHGFRAAAFTLPFVAVTVFCLSQSNADCLAHGPYACQLSALIIGTLAGLTSMLLMGVISGYQKKKN